MSVGSICNHPLPVSNTTYILSFPCAGLFSLSINALFDRAPATDATKSVH
jgi:hypothetical protein